MLMTLEASFPLALVSFQVKGFQVTTFKNRANVAKVAQVGVRDFN